VGLLASSPPAGPVSRSRPPRRPSSPSWAGKPLPRLGLPPSARVGRFPCLSAGQPAGWAAAPAGPPRPDWAALLACAPGGLPPALYPAGRDQEDPAWLGFLPWAGLTSPGRAYPGRSFAGQAMIRLYPGWATFCLLFWPGQAGIPWPRPDYSSPGPRLTPSGIFTSSSFTSSTLCQFWDASRLELAYPPPSYAGLGTPHGSDQHIPPLLVSLILRRRIRLMTWGS
jgi:hypothetical protein